MRLTLLLPLLACLATPALAEQKTYRVTGPLVEATADKIVIQKSKKVKWEMARTSATQLPAEAKPGDKVQVEYTMTAAKVNVKEAAKPAAPAAKPVAAKPQPAAATKP